MEELNSKADPIDEKLFRELTKQLDAQNWQNLATQLDFTKAEISKFCDYPGHIDEQIFQMLVTWKQRQKTQNGNTLVKKLATCLKKVGRNDIAAEITERTDRISTYEPPSITVVPHNQVISEVPPAAYNNMIFKVLTTLDKGDDHVKHIRYLLQGAASDHESIKRVDLQGIFDAEGLIAHLQDHYLLGVDNTWFFQYLIYLVRNKEAYRLVLEYTAKRMKQSPILSVFEPPEIQSGEVVTLRVHGNVNEFRKISLEKFRQLLADRCNGELVYVNSVGLKEGSIVLHFEVTQTCCKALFSAATDQADWLTENRVLEVSVSDENGDIVCIPIKYNDDSVLKYHSQADKNVAVLYALLNDETEKVKSALKDGGDVNSVCGGKSLLLWAAELNKLEIVELLLNSGAHPNMLSDDGATVLHKAAFLGLPNICKRLLQCEDTIAHIPDKLGNTPLHLATDQDLLAFLEARRPLVEGEPTTKNEDRGRTDSATSQNDFGTSKVLLEYGNAVQIKEEKRDNGSSGSLDEVYPAWKTARPQKEKRRQSRKDKLTEELLESWKGITKSGLISKFLTFMGHHGNKPPGSMPCKKRWCKICQHIISTSTISSTKNDKTFAIQQHITCATRNVVYLVQCKTCKQQFVGETSEVFRSEVALLLAALADVENKEEDLCIAKHFSQDDHNVDDIEMVGVEAMGNKSDNERVARTNFWITELQSMESFGPYKECRTTVTPRYTYDAFLYNSEKDFTASFDIFKKLEQEGLRCCMGYRDFLPGCNVVDQILQSIQNSQKVILVLSPDFVADELCRFVIMVAGAEMKKRPGGDSIFISLLVRECVTPEELKSSRCFDFTQLTKESSDVDFKELVRMVRN